MTSEPLPPDPPERIRRTLDQLTRELAELQQIVATLVYVLFDEGSSEELFAAQDALANWAMAVFDLETLNEIVASYGEPLPAFPPAACSAASQKELFSLDFEERSDGCNRP